MDPKVDNGAITYPSKGQASNNSKQEKGKGKEKEESGDIKDLTIEELEEQICRYKMYLKRLKAERRQRKSNSSLEQLKTKKLSQAQAGVLRYMLNMTDKYELCGFVYGLVPKNGKPISGSSYNLKGWWNDRVKFDRNGPAAISKYEEKKRILTMNNTLNGEPAMPYALRKLSDPTLASLISVLMPECNPPQRKYPLKKGVQPPWWPTGEEPWWTEMRFSEDQDPGPPPYKKPHNLKKAWKACVLMAIIKHMATNIENMKTTVRNSPTLQDKLTAKETAILVAVIDNEERIARDMSPCVGGSNDLFVETNDYDVECGQQTLEKPLPKPHHHDHVHGDAFVGSDLIGNGGGQNQVQPNFDWVDRCLMNKLFESGSNKRKAGELVESSTTSTAQNVNSSSQRNFSVMTPYEVSNKRTCELGMSYMMQYENYSLQQDMNVRNNNHSASREVGSRSRSSSINSNNNQFQMVDVGGSKTHQDVAPLDQHVHAAIPNVPNESTNHTGNYSGPGREEVMNTIPIPVVNQNAVIPNVPNESTNHTGNYSGGREEEVMNTIPTPVVNQNMQPQMDNNFNGEQEVTNMQPNVVADHANVSTTTTYDSSFDLELEAFHSQFDGEANNNIPFIDSPTVETPPGGYDFTWFYNNY